jgi:hypothetical protein
MTKNIVNACVSGLLKGLFAIALTVTILATAHVAQAQTAPQILYTSSTGSFSTTSETQTFIGGNLELTLPPASAGTNNALVTLDLPNLYLSGGSTSVPGAIVYVTINNVPVATGMISTEAPVNGQNSGRKPMTIVVSVPLTNAFQNLSAQWEAVRGATVHTDTFASLSALLTQ